MVIMRIKDNFNKKAYYIWEENYYLSHRINIFNIFDTLDCK